jgi:ribosomal-protein-alanine N-acetyltransferase
VLRIEREAFGQRAWSADLFHHYAATGANLFLVARVGSTVAAYSITRTSGNRAELDSIAVGRRFQNRGIGGAFLRWVIRKLEGGGCATLCLMVRRDNEGAIRFYRSLGFQRIRTVPYYYEDGETGWRMQLVMGVSKSMV